MNKYKYSFIITISILILLLININDATAGDRFFKSIIIVPEEPVQDTPTGFNVEFGNNYDYAVNDIELKIKVSYAVNLEIAYSYTSTKFDTPATDDYTFYLPENDYWIPTSPGDYKLEINIESPDDVDPSNNTYIGNFYVLPKAIELTPPTLTSPLNNSDLDGMTAKLEWEFEQALMYDIRVALNSDHENGHNEKIEGGSYTFQPNYLRFGKTYYWGARTRDGEKTSDWSDSWSFNTPQFPVVDVTSPQDAAETETLTPTIEWGDLGTDFKYDFKLSLKYDLTEKIVEENEIEHNSYSIGTGLLDYDKTYYYQIKPKYMEQEGEWTDVYSFITPEDATGVISTYVTGNMISSYRLLFNILEIDYTVENPSNIQIEVIDLKGRTVYSQNLGLINDGLQRTRIDMSSFMSGTYVVSLKTSSIVSSIKIIK